MLDDDESSSSEMEQYSRQSGESLASLFPQQEVNSCVILPPMFVFAEEQKKKLGSSLQKKPDLVQTPDLHLELDSPGSSDVLDPILHSSQV